MTGRTMGTKMRMMEGRLSVNPNKQLVIGLAEGRDVCVSRGHDADILLVSSPRPSPRMHSWVSHATCITIQVDIRHFHVIFSNLIAIP